MKKEKSYTEKILDRRTKEYKRWIVGCLYAAEANCHPPLTKIKQLSGH